MAAVLAEFVSAEFPAATSFAPDSLPNLGAGTHAEIGADPRVFRGPDVGLGVKVLAAPAPDAGAETDPDPEFADFPYETLRTGAPLSIAGLVFLRSRDADGRIQVLVGERRGARLLLGTLAGPLVSRRRFEPLGFRSLGDFARERLGVSATAVREWARVAGALSALPCLRAAVEAGTVSWSVARRAVAFAAPETDAVFVEALQGRTVQAAQALLREAFGSTPDAATAAAEAQDAGKQSNGGEASLATDDSQHEKILVRVPLAGAHHGRWQAALELARRVAGEALPVWECAEAMAGEALSALPPALVAEAATALCGDVGVKGLVRAQQAGPSPAVRSESERPTCVAKTARGGASTRDACAARMHGPKGGAAHEHGFRQAAFPGLRWNVPAGGAPLDLDAMRAWADAASPHALDRALRRVLARLQAIDHDLGHVLRQVVDRRLYAELGFATFERYAQERVDVSPRTARRWVRMARLGPVGSAVAKALRAGSLTPKQASLVAEAVGPSEQAPLVEHARGVTLRRLEDDLAGAAPQRAALVFSAPREAATVFRLALEAVRLHLAPAGASANAGSAGAQHALLWILDHAILTWEEQGAQFDDYADFRRDGFRCTVPGCTARRNLQSHHIVFRSRGGPDEPSNRTTLCAFHHLRGVHAGTVSCHGQAPAGLVFALGLRSGGPPLLRAASGDVLVQR